MSNNNNVEVNFGPSGVQLQLLRNPRYTDEKLRAWDAADEYILNHIDEQQLASESFAESSAKSPNVLIINDSYGALTLGVAGKTSSITSMTDSANTHSAIRSNATLNNLDVGHINLLSSADFSNESSDSLFDLVLIKVPKSLAQLEDNLRRIHHRISDKTVVIGAGMAKNIHNSTLELFENIIGPTKTSLARKKARLIFSQVLLDQSATTDEPIEPLPPTPFIVDKEVSKTSKPLYMASYASVFSHAKLDMGTRFLLEHMHIPESANDVLDLGCGTGILGLAAALRNPNATVTFVDESYMSIESTKESIKLSLPEERAKTCTVAATHCMEGIEDNSQDIILNNPPFHDAGAQTSNIAVEMFSESKRVLRVKGTLLVVANRHLGYHKRLKEIFGRCELIADNGKFVILKAIRWR